MLIYLPIAEMTVNVGVIVLLGVVTGILSGLFGVGGGFLTTPFLIFIGVPPAVSVSTTANQIIAASFSGFLTHWRKRNVDFRMGVLLLIGGFLGSFLGIGIFRWLTAIGQIDLIISILYVTLLGSIGTLLLRETLRARKALPDAPAAPSRTRLWVQQLPWKMHFATSQVTLSILLPLALGLLSGVMVALLGVGGGFFMIPAMIYLLRMSPSAVVGTSLFQIIFITANVTFMHAISTRTVDLVLAFLLILGSAVGAQLGTRLGARMKPETLRLMLAVLVIAIALRLLYGLVITPEDIYQVTVMDL